MSDAETSFIVFADDWGVHPSSSQHLFRRIATDHDVLWVNTIGLRRPQWTLQDVGKALQKAQRMFRDEGRSARHKDDPPRLYVCQPFMLPFASNRLVRALNARSVRRTVMRWSRKLALHRPVLVAATPAAGDMAGQLGESKTVYYCVDDFSEWAGHDHQLVRDMEARLIARTDIAIAASHLLQSQLAAMAQPAVLLSHGADLELFSDIPEREHPALAGIGYPRIGYFGAIDERMDIALIEKLAKARPDIAFILGGPLLTNVLRLQNLPNVHFTGVLAYAHLPYLVAGLNGLILPYKVDRSTAAISPLKLKEYLATGRPVVASPLAEIISFSEHLRVARNVDDWLSAIDRAAATPLKSGRQILPDWLAAHGWNQKVDEFLETVK